MKIEYENALLEQGKSGHTTLADGNEKTPPSGKVFGGLLVTTAGACSAVVYETGHANVGDLSDLATMPAGWYPFRATSYTGDGTQEGLLIHADAFPA